MKKFFINVHKPMPSQGFVSIPKRAREYFPIEDADITLRLRGEQQILTKRYNNRVSRIFGLKDWFTRHKIRPGDKLRLKVLKPRKEFYLGLKRIRKGVTQEEASKLIGNYIENIDKDLLKSHKKDFKQWFKNERGVYALYNGAYLYYVGMGQIPGRILQHLRDRHRGQWDKCSAYVVKREKYTRELETLLSRFAKPMGAEAVGKLPQACNIKYELKRLLRAKERELKKWRKRIK